jgi:hypothetical protein
VLALGREGGVRRTWQRIVRAHHFYVLAVARRSRVGNEYTIDRRVRAPEARQPNAHAHQPAAYHPRREFTPSTGAGAAKGSGGRARCP